MDNVCCSSPEYKIFKTQHPDNTMQYSVVFNDNKPCYYYVQTDSNGNMVYEEISWGWSYNPYYENAQEVSNLEFLVVVGETPEAVIRKVEEHIGKR